MTVVPHRETPLRQRPSDDEVRRLYADEGLSLSEVAERIGFSTSWVRKRLKALGARRRPAHQPVGAKRIDEAAETALVEEILVLYVDQGLSLSAIASRFGRSSWWVRQRLIRAGVATRPRGGHSGDPVDEQLLAAMAQRYVDGATCAEIGAQVGMSGSWVRDRLTKAGIPLQLGPRSSLDDATEARILRLYVEERRTMRATATLVGVSDAVAKRVLVSAGIPVRGHNASRSIDCQRLRELYVDDGLTTTAIAQRLGVSSSGVSSALRRCGIPPRATGTELTIDTKKLRRHVDSGMSDQEIADKYNVTPWAVRRRLRREGIRRPPAKPPYTRPSPPEDDLRARYVDQDQTLAEIATTYQVPHPTVRRWLRHAGITRREKNHTPPTAHHPALTKELLTDLYVHDEWTAAEIGRHVGISKKIVLTALHSHGLPVRPPGARRPANEPVLDRLYSDPDVAAALNRHRVPTVPTPGPLRDRFPTPAPLNTQLLDDLYIAIGLSTGLMSLLTGYTETSIRQALQQAGIPAREQGTRGPWAQRQTAGPAST